MEKEWNPCFMLRKLTVLFMSVVLCLTTLSCGSPSTTQSQNQNRDFQSTSTQAPLSAGKYPVQQATYDDANGEYTLMLLNTPPGTPSTYRTTNLRMARLTEAEIAAGEKTYLQVENNQADMHLSEDFKIEYVHNVVENQTNPQTGQQETVIVRRESNFWSPFFGALAGQALGSLLFTPQYYVPPVYRPGVALQGYGGYGSNYNQAVERYQTRYKAPPAAVRNRTAFRSTGRLRSTTSNQPRINRRTQNGSRAPGSGFGASDLNRSNRSTTRRSPGSSFGSGGRSRTPSRSFGSRRRR
jgi:hypothetical protein